MGDSSGLGKCAFPTMLLQSDHVALAPCFPLASHPHGAETWFLEAEKELRRAGRRAWIACFISGNLYTETFRNPGN